MLGKVPTRSIHRFGKYRLLKTLTKNFNILSNAANADADVTAIALPVPGIFLTLLGTGPVLVPLGKIATYCSKLGIFTVW